MSDVDLKRVQQIIFDWEPESWPPGEGTQDDINALGNLIFKAFRDIRNETIDAFSDYLEENLDPDWGCEQMRLEMRQVLGARLSKERKNEPI